MKTFRLSPVLLLLCLLPVVLADARQPEKRRTPPDICQLFGAVYVEQQAAFADYRVYKEEIESFAKLVVYREEAEDFADRPGFWYFTDVKAFADFTIAYESNQGLADFTIAFTDFRSAAGCP